MTFLEHQAEHTTKIYKTGQTRGADDDVIYQNRVLRNSTVLIPYREYQNCKIAPSNNGIFENGYIAVYYKHLRDHETKEMGLLPTKH